MSVTREPTATRSRSAISRIRAAMDKALQRRAIEAEHRIQTGEVSVYSPDESREWMAEFANKVKATRRRITQK